MKFKVIIFAICMMTLSVIAAGCVPQQTTPTTPTDTTNVAQPSTPVELAPGTYQEVSLDVLATTPSTLQFEDADSFKQFVTNYRSEGYFGGGIAFRSTGGDVAVMEMAMDSAESAPTMAKAGFDGDVDFSETNNQVSGVDEADILKTDGNYIYTITDNTLFIVAAYPGADAEVVSTIELDDGQPTGLFVSGDELIVFGNLYTLDFFDELDIAPRNGMTYYQVYDISDRESPAQTKQFRFEGSYFNARMVDNMVYFVTRNSPDYRLPEPMPLIIEDNVARSIPVDDIYYFDIPYRNPQFVTVHSIAMDTHKTNSASVAVEWGQNMYMSHNNLYITYNQYINEWELQQEITMELLEPHVTDLDRAIIEKIKATDNDVLSQQEKKNKIQQIYMSYQQYLSSEEQEEMYETAEKLLAEKLEEVEHFEFTVVNRIALNDGDVTVEANGKVPGSITNQFSMDEFESTFRIATTINQRWSRFGKQRTESTNNVFTLDMDLEVLDHLGDIAEGERIFATRFMGERLYMVTFRQVDPFFVIDMSDPSNIETLGELKIPGFSRYLHPYDENTIIGIGQDATLEGRAQGLKISLFDVSDVTDPQEVAQFVTDEKYAQSTALYEHKAFLFSKEKNLLVIPAYSYKYHQRNPTGYNGAFVFDISKDEIELRGLIDHSEGRSQQRYWYQPMVERSLYIEELLYTKSPYLLRINALDDLEGVKNVELKPKGSSTIEIY